ncbi:MFS transporter [Sciscionella marina]|uniref:MFS transporter n=1 Tax=Sciscionella marina TaxID=508770 RepID=UPI0003712C77|nr:MFS transporter [Sciscionella marina]
MRINYRWTVVGGLTCLLAAANAADRGVFGIVAPQRQRIYGLVPTEIGLISSAFGIGFATCQLLFSGAIVRRLGAKTTMVGSVVLWSIMLGLTAASSSVISFFLTRFLFGISESPNWPATQSLLSNWFPTRDTQRSFNLAWSGLPQGGILGPPLAVALIAALGWRGLPLAPGLGGTQCPRPTRGVRADR